ncbi:unnamed protein product [Spirodela intermedia]|uniref:GUN4-like domain-containing protein n=1 Tax=Spirodela intermedia TaxID=51605 RepID=A0A7I8JDV4_SPIIN|nr:unnamed protein product [Spirodela intermedia]CAA6668289.1 unnamed protein product [Spirodela intermedia]
MAAASLQSLRLPHQRHNRHRHFSFTFPSSSSSPSLLRQKKVFSGISSSSSSSAAAASVTTPSAATPSTSGPPSLELLAQHLAAGDFRQADDVTRRLLIVLAGEPAQKRGYVFFSEVQFISAEDLQAIDRLWGEHSGGKYGYSVQRRVWEKTRRDFTRFFVKVGWMKKLDTDVEQYNYRSFPEEGTQLLGSILTHPAFEGAAGEDDLATGGGEPSPPAKGLEETKSAGVRRLFKTDYSF